jgi:hypothetical protein
MISGDKEEGEDWHPLGLGGVLLVAALSCPKGKGLIRDRERAFC